MNEVVHRIPSVAANPRKAYLYQEKAWWVEPQDACYVEMMAQWAVANHYCGSIQRFEQQQSKMNMDIPPMPTLDVPHGLLLEPYLYWVGKHNLSKFLTNLSASALVALVGGVLFLLGLGHNMDKVIIGSIIRLVPGMALTTSIRDFFHGDYLSGAIRMLDAVLVGGCIAVGVGVVVRLLSLLTGGALL